MIMETRAPLRFKLSCLGSALISTLCAGCFDEVTFTPECFLEVNEQARESAVVETGVCCEPGPEGDQSCASLFISQGYTETSKLALCTERERCRLCEIGVSCECLNNRDCAEDQICSVVDDATRCAERLDLPEGSRRCSICVTGVMSELSSD